MAEIAHSIDLNLPEKLKDLAYRQRFFLAESSAQIAAQLIALRKRRDLNQQEVAELIGTQQPAISRIEKADYQSWSFTVLRKIADALDARLRVIIEPSEDILREYSEDQLSAESSELAAIKEILRTPTSSVPAQQDERGSGDLLSLLGELTNSAARYRSTSERERETNDQGGIPKLNPKNSSDLQRDKFQLR
jgi:transcriptional regulator with XRE-family HTH domain